MVENDRYYRDELQQASAIVAAVREVALLLIAQHLEMGATVAAGSQRKPAVEEMRAVLRLALAQCPEVGGTAGAEKSPSHYAHRPPSP
jgi:DNA-binding FrmR family transcriptional regulator